MKHIVVKLLLCCGAITSVNALEARLPVTHSGMLLRLLNDSKANSVELPRKFPRPLLQSPSFTSIELQPTVAYLNHHGTPARMVRMRFHGGKNYQPAVVYMFFNGRED
ncbi:hypothetical protein, partial [Chitinophaga sp.]|uniref:hypothetical protein n=1 Tax=Chitinophaga sp. TaxID=1869181 RepID=UPI002F938254